MKQAYILVLLGLDINSGQIVARRIGVYSERGITIDQNMILLELARTKAETYEEAYKQAAGILAANKVMPYWPFLERLFDVQLREEISGKPVEGVEKHRLRVPTIHLNGTSKKGLLEALETATSVLHRAEQAVAETAPNGRDYYPQGEGAFDEARNQHDLRAARLHSVREELCEIWEKIE